MSGWSTCVRCGRVPLFIGMRLPWCQWCRMFVNYRPAAPPTPVCPQEENPNDG